MDQRKLVIATVRKAVLGFPPCTTVVAGDRKERSCTNGTWQTYLIADDRPSCVIDAVMAWRFSWQAVAEYTCSLVVGTLPEFPTH